MRGLRAVAITAVLRQSLRRSLLERGLALSHCQLELEKVPLQSDQSEFLHADPPGSRLVSPCLTALTIVQHTGPAAAVVTCPASVSPRLAGLPSPSQPALHRSYEV